MPNFGACVALAALLSPAGFLAQNADDDKLDQSGLPVLAAAVNASIARNASPNARWVCRTICSWSLIWCGFT